MPTRLRLSCRALLILVLVRLNFYSADGPQASHHELNSALFLLCHFRKIASLDIGRKSLDVAYFISALLLFLINRPIYHIIEEYAEHNQPNIDNEKQASQIPDILVVTRASIRRWTYYPRDVGTRYGPVSLCLSVTNRCFIKTAGKIELILAWRLLSTYHRPIHCVIRKFRHVEK